MTIASGPRPFAIRVFAAAFLAAAFIRLGQGLSDLPAAKLRLTGLSPWLASSDDAAIIALSAEFTIALIPIIWIHLFANPHARWLVLGFGLLKLAGFRSLAMLMLQSGVFYPLALFEPFLILIAMLCLLMPSANRWLHRREEVDPAVFD